MSGLPKGFPAVAETSSDEKEHRRQLAQIANRLNRGKFNATGSITLRASQTTTTLTDERIGATSYIDFMPTTAHGATAKQSIFMTNFIKGAATINHASSANTDQSFVYAVLG